MLYDELMDTRDGNFLKMNPPLRPKHMQEKMLQLLLDNEIDYIASDHAPHTLAEKQSANPPSGIPVLPYYPEFLTFLANKGMSAEQLSKLTHDNIIQNFKLPPNTIHNSGHYFSSDSVCTDLAAEYGFNPFEVLR